MTEKTCIICHGNDLTNKTDTSGEVEVVKVECANCGSYSVSRPCVKLLYHYDYDDNIAKYQPSDEQRRIISGYLYYTGDVLVNELSLPTLMALKQPTIVEKANRLIMMVFRHSDSFGSGVQVIKQWITAALVMTADETNSLAKHLTSEGLLECENAMAGEYSLTFNGWEMAEKLSLSIESNYVFIAMWFDKVFRAATEPAIREAITSSGMQPLTVDQDEHVGKIDDKIILDINRSRAIVADFTKHRGGVYFEAGYAMGRGLPVVWTCHTDHAEKLHFDIRQYNCIVWSDVTELGTKLEARLKSLFEN